MHSARIKANLPFSILTAHRSIPALSTINKTCVARESGNSSTTKAKSQLDIVSWNINYSDGYPTQRSHGLISHVLEGGIPDILCLQEVRPDVRASLLGESKVRRAFLPSQIEAGLENKRFTTMTLLSRHRFTDGKNPGEEGFGKFRVKQIFRRQLPSAMDRDGLCVDLIPPHAQDTFIRIINVHLDSYNMFSYRAQQLSQLAKDLREAGCSGGAIVGDFNAITDDDDRLINANRLEDAWLTLHGDTEPDAPTWNVGRGRSLVYEPKRLDKVAMVGLVAETMEVIHPSFIDAPNPRKQSRQVEWSDHSGLRCKVHF